jgi:hypothetical protein
MKNRIQTGFARLHYRVDIASFYVMWPFWTAADWTRLKLARASLQDGEECGQLGTWSYMPADDNCYLCDVHVPRGCTCHEEQDRPCVEWFRSRFGYRR